MKSKEEWIKQLESLLSQKENRDVACLKMANYDYYHFLKRVYVTKLN